MKKIIQVLALTLFTTISAFAGTIGMSGQWDFSGNVDMYDPAGFLLANPSLSGDFDFDAGTVGISSNTPYFGMIWSSSGTITDQLNGTYLAVLESSWGASLYSWEILWDISQTGNTASVLTVDMDGDGIPGMMLPDGPFAGNSQAINGTLTAVVPVPAAAWLFASGLLGLMGFAKRKS